MPVPRLRWYFKNAQACLDTLHGPGKSKLQNSHGYLKVLVQISARPAGLSRRHNESPDRS